METDRTKEGMWCVRCDGQQCVRKSVLYVVVGPVEADPEYQLIVESNNLVVEIDNEISE